MRIYCCVKPCLPHSTKEKYSVLKSNWEREWEEWWGRKLSSKRNNSLKTIQFYFRLNDSLRSYRAILALNLISIWNFQNKCKKKWKSYIKPKDRIALFVSFGEISRALNFLWILLEKWEILVETKRSSKLSKALHKQRQNAILATTSFLLCYLHKKQRNNECGIQICGIRKSAWDKEESDQIEQSEDWLSRRAMKSKTERKWYFCAEKCTPKFRTTHNVSINFTTHFISVIVEVLRRMWVAIMQKLLCARFCTNPLYLVLHLIEKYQKTIRYLDEKRWSMREKLYRRAGN